MLGFDFRDSQGDFDFRVGDFDSLNIFNPVHASAKPVTAVADLLQHNKIQEYGIYGQDQIHLPGYLQLMFGGRYDVARARRWAFTDPVDKSDEEKFSPCVGLVFAPDSFWSIYATYTESFSSTNFRVNRSGQAFHSVRKPVLNKKSAPRP